MKGGHVSGAVRDIRSVFIRNYKANASLCCPKFTTMNAFIICNHKHISEIVFVVNTWIYTIRWIVVLIMTEKENNYQNPPLTPYYMSYTTPFKEMLEVFERNLTLLLSFTLFSLFKNHILDWGCSILLPNMPSNMVTAPVAMLQILFSGIAKPTGNRSGIFKLRSADRRGSAKTRRRVRGQQRVIWFYIIS